MTTVAEMQLANEPLNQISSLLTINEHIRRKFLKDQSSYLKLFMQPLLNLHLQPQSFSDLNTTVNNSVIKSA